MKERGNILVILLGILLIFFLIGFFRSDKSFFGTFNFKTILQLPCGLTVSNPKFAKDEKVVFPLKIDGYINGCGWNPDKNKAGMVQIFDAQGKSVTAPISLNIPSDSAEEPFYFSTVIIPNSAPHTDTGNIIITSTTGLIYSIQVWF